jgi:hypothetical protein
MATETMTYRGTTITRVSADVWTFELFGGQYQLASFQDCVEAIDAIRLNRTLNMMAKHWNGK